MELDRLQLQMMVTQKEAMLTVIFQNALAVMDADQGYLGFVDPNEHLRILVQKGEYWHLPADRGVSGTAFQERKTQIDDAGSKRFRQSQAESKVKSEIAVPVTMNNESVGILLFDSHREARRFDREDQRYLENEAAKISEVLDEKDPWSFRSWWAGERDARHQSLFAEIVKHLRWSLREKFSRQPDVEIRIAEVDHRGVAGRFEMLLEPAAADTAKVSDDEGDPLQRTIMLGRSVITGQPVPRYRCYVPFPLVGPVLGLVRLESSEDTTLSDETAIEIEAEIRKIEVDPLRLSQGSVVNNHFYLNYLYRILISHLGTSSLASVLEGVAHDASRLCGQAVTIACAKESFAGLLPEGSDGPEILSRSDLLLKLFGKGKESTQRPARFTRLENLTACPVFNFRDEPIAGLTVVRTNKEVEDNFNDQVLENTAMLLKHLFESFRMRAAFDASVGSTTKERTGRRPEASIVSPSSTRPQSEVTGLADWLYSAESIRVDDYRVVGDFVVAEKQARGALVLEVAKLKQQVGGNRNSPYPVLLCASPGSGKTFFVKEFVRDVVGKGKTNREWHSPLVIDDLSFSTDIVGSLRKHLTRILMEEAPRIALLDEVDTRVGSETAYRFLKSAIEGSSVDLGQGIEIKLPGVVWFFAASSAQDRESFEELLSTEEKGADFYRRFNQGGKILTLPGLGGPRDAIIQSVCNARAMRPELTKIEARLLYYIGVSKWSDAGELRGVISTALKDTEGRDLLTLSSVAGRADYASFVAQHREAIGRLESVILNC